MAQSPFTAGDGRTWPDQAFTTESGIFALTSATNGAIALHLADINNNGALYVCTGAWSITNAAGGIAEFTPSPADLLPSHPLGMPGLYRAYPVVTLTTGPVAMDPQIIQVVSLP